MSEIKRKVRFDHTARSSSSYKNPVVTLKIQLIGDLQLKDWLTFVNIHRNIESIIINSVDYMSYTLSIHKPTYEKTTRSVQGFKVLYNLTDSARLSVWAALYQERKSAAPLCRTYIEIVAKILKKKFNSRWTALMKNNQHIFNVNDEQVIHDNTYCLDIIIFLFMLFGFVYLQKLVASLL